MKINDYPINAILHIVNATDPFFFYLFSWPSLSSVLVGPAKQRPKHLRYSPICKSIRFSLTFELPSLASTSTKSPKIAALGARSVPERSQAQQHQQQLASYHQSGVCGAAFCSSHQGYQSVRHSQSASPSFTRSNCSPQPSWQPHHGPNPPSQRTTMSRHLNSFL